MRIEHIELKPTATQQALVQLAVSAGVGEGLRRVFTHDSRSSMLVPIGLAAVGFAIANPNIHRPSRESVGNFLADMVELCLNQLDARFNNELTDNGNGTWESTRLDED